MNFPRNFRWVSPSTSSIGSGSSSFTSGGGSSTTCHILNEFSTKFRSVFAYITDLCNERYGSWRWFGLHFYLLLFWYRHGRYRVRYRRWLHFFLFFNRWAFKSQHKITTKTLNKIYLIVVSIALRRSYFSHQNFVKKIVEFTFGQLFGIWPFSWHSLYSGCHNSIIFFAMSRSKTGHINRGATLLWNFVIIIVAFFMTFQHSSFFISLLE